MPPPARAEDATGTAASAPGAAASTPARRADPKIGVVLSGGGARGLTHIGVLKVLEEMRVPIDYITATSMGSIVGGLYATGVSASDMERLVTSLDWPAFFSDQPPRRELSVRRKLEDALYTIPLELGFRDFSFKLATGALTGQNLELLLHGLTWREDDIGSFDNLPIPFRAVATNLVDGREVVFDHGPLYIAMRGSMSIPGIFAPLDLDGRMLGDGGLVKNLPVDIIKSMGAEVVIAINIGTPLMTREQLSSFFGVAEQSINILTEQNVRAQRALLVPPRDVLIEPDLGDLSAADFNKGARFIALGEKAARASADALSRYALSADDYAAYRLALRRPQRTRRIRSSSSPASAAPRSPTPRSCRRRSISSRARRSIFRRHRPISPRSTDAATSRGSTTSSSVQPPQRGVQFVVAEKPWGPDYLVFGVGFSSDTQGENTFGLRTRYKRTWLNSLGGEWINDIALGTTNYLRSELYQPLNLAQTVFAAPYAGIGTTTENIFAQGIKVAEYRVLDERVGIDLGLRIRQLGRRAGRAVVCSRARRSGGRLAAISGNVAGRMGTRAPRPHRYAGQCVLSAPRLAPYVRRLHRYAAATRRGSQSVARASSTCTSRSRSATRTRSTSGCGSPEPTFSIPTLLGNFRLGGFLEISGLRYRELEGSYLGRARAVFLHRMGALPVFGNTYYLGGSLEAGNVWQQRSAISFGDTIKAGSVFFAADTPFGPFYIAWGHTNRGDSTWYLLLGRP